MEQFTEIFERYEKKYLLSKEQFRAVLNGIKSYMDMDSYGLSTISNIYYDTDGYDLIRRSLEKPKYKEKLRVRSYGIPKRDGTVFIELKKKYNGVVYKRRVSMKLDEADAFIKHGIIPESATPQIVKEINYFLEFYRPVPKMYIAYDRVAMFGRQDAKLRITFDTKIRSRDYDLDLSSGDYGRLLLKPSQVLMEIKVPGVYPNWMAKMLSELDIYTTSFSKYGMIYKRAFRDRLLQDINQTDEEGELCLLA